MVLKKGVLSYLVGSVIKNELDNIKYKITYCILAKMGLSHIKIVMVLLILI